jgi:hypothetical protein
MKNKKPLEIAATIGLGAICAFLILRLVVRVRAMSAGPSAGVAVDRPVSREMRRVVIPLAPKPLALPESPALNVALFDQLQAQSLAAPDRDPFSFTPTPQQIQQRAGAPAAENRPKGPPPPPPVPLKALGYMQDTQGKLQAYLADSQNIYAVHEGEKFDKVYRVLKVTPAFIEIEDESLNLRAQLAIPQ